MRTVPVDFPNLRTRFHFEFGMDDDCSCCLCVAAAVANTPHFDLLHFVAKHFHYSSFDDLYTCCAAVDCAEDEKTRVCINTYDINMYSMRVSIYSDI